MLVCHIAIEFPSKVIHWDIINFSASRCITNAKTSQLLKFNKRRNEADNNDGTSMGILIAFSILESSIYRITSQQYHGLIPCVSKYYGSLILGKVTKSTTQLTN